MDFSLRVPSSKTRTAVLEKFCKSKKQLTRIKDYLYTPNGESVKSFDPNYKWIRLREFLEDDLPATLTRGEVILTNEGYSDKKEKLGTGTLGEMKKLANKNNFKLWGEIATVTIEFDLGYAQVLSQNLTSIGEYLKIESETEEGLKKVMELLDIKVSEKITKNAAVLLAEKKGLI